MLSRLKGIETCRDALPATGVLNALDMLSRLKGIETFWNKVCAGGYNHFRYAFPFEGN